MSRALPTRALAARARPRTRAILQNTDAECGLACLAMVLGHHGNRTTLRELRDRCTPGRDGVSAGALARLGRASGLDVKGYPADPAAIGQLPLPAIAHWSDDHFVVVDRVTKRRVHLVDPALGRRQLRHSEFAAQLGRAVLVAQPGPDFQRRAATARPFWRTYVRELLRVPRTIRLLAQVLAVTVLTQALVLVMPLATRTVVDHLGALRGSEILPLLAAGIVAAGLAQLVTGLVRSSLLVYLQARLDTAAFLAFTAHLLRLPLQFFERRSTGDIMTRFASIAMLRDLMTTQTLSASLDAVLALGYLGALTVVFPALAGAVAAVIATIVLLLVFSANAVRERMAADLANQGRTQGFVVEALEGIATVKAAGVEGRMVDEAAHLVRDWMATSVRRTYLSAVIDSVTTALRSLAPLLVLWLCATRVVDGAMTTGTMLATTWLASAIVTPLASVVANGQGLQLAGAQLQRLADVFETPAEPPAAMSTEPLRGAIDVRSVSYRYDTYSPLVLEDVTLRVGPGQRLAVVGTTGSGKTTLGMLLLGLYPASGGEIRIDGERLDVEAAQRLRRRIGVVLQEPHVFSGTIAENIALRDPTVTPDEIERAARLACLHDDVIAMPNRYGTRLAPRGAGLSGGQRQRLALARALVRRPAILLLDEATSHLDTATEASIYRNLAELDCVQIVIAHRLSTVRDADQIVVLERGRVVECGTHDTLLAAAGAYARLVAAQVVDARAPESASVPAPAPAGATTPEQPAGQGRFRVDRREEVTFHGAPVH